MRKRTRYNFHKKLFNLIAPYYQWFFHSQLKTYRKLLEIRQNLLQIPADAKILDLGCGTGAFGCAFQEHGYRVIGIDGSPQMLERAQKNNLSVMQVDLLHPPFPFSDNSFDLVIAANVIHGFQKEEREKIYQEAARLTKKHVLFHDYVKNRNIVVALIEWIEQGDYFNFIRQIPAEFFQYFKKVDILPNFNSYSAWYLCIKN